MLSNEAIERLSQQVMHAVRYEDLDDRHGAFTREFARLIETAVREQVEDTGASEHRITKRYQFLKDVFDSERAEDWTELPWCAEDSDQLEIYIDNAFAKEPGK